MTSLLIHSDNTALLQIDRLEKNEVFFSLPENKGVDEYISEFINERIVPVKANAIFIKYALTDNYLGFLGLRLACHLRLELEKEISQIPIVFVGEETPFELMKLSDFSEIIVTPGVYHIDESISDAKEILEKLGNNDLKGLTNYKKFLEQIDVKAPSNYDTRHSIANELSLYLWSKYIGCEDHLSEVQQHIQNKLYFKYKAVTKNYYEVQDKIDALPDFDQNATVMLVDDEAQKGWGIFYEHYFSDFEGVQIITQNIDSRLDQDSIIKNCLKDITEIDPDLILLDLRLNEADVDISNPNRLTGYQILKAVKKNNPGIQVIITTASNKAPVFKELMKVGASGYIIKNNHPKESIQLLTNDINEAIKEAKALKGYYSKLQNSYKKIKGENLEKIVTHRSDDNQRYKNFCQDILYYLDMASETFINTKVEERFSYGILQLYKILETIKGYYINVTYDRDKKREKYEFVGEGVIKDFDHRNNYRVTGVRSRLNTSKLIYNVYYSQTGEIDQGLFYDIHQLVQYRNNYAHHTDPNDYYQLGYTYLEDFSKFRKDFYQYYSCVFKFINDITD